MKSSFCIFCRRFVRNTIHACVIGGVLAGPIATGDVKQIQDAAGAVADLFSSSSTATTAPPAHLFGSQWVGTATGLAEQMPFNIYDWPLPKRPRYTVQTDMTAGSTPETVRATTT